MSVVTADITCTGTGQHMQSSRPKFTVCAGLRDPTNTRPPSLRHHRRHATLLYLPAGFTTPSAL